MPTAAQTIRPTGDGEPTADEKKRFDSCTRICYNEDSHRTRSQAICGRFVCTGIRCRTEADAAHSAQRGKNLKGLAAVESKYSILEAAQAIGISKNTVKYRLRKLPPETISKDDAGRIWISADGLELLRKQAETAPDEPTGKNHQEPDERTTGFSAEPPRTGRRTSLNHLEPVNKPVYEPLSTGRKTTINHLEPVEEPPRTTDADQLEALRAQLDRLRNDLDICREQRDKEEKRAAVAAAELDAERKRADENAQTVSDLTAALQSEQQHAAELTALLQTAHEQLTAALALNAGQIQLQMQQSEPAAQPAAVTAEPANDQPGDTRSASEARDTAEDQQTTGDGADDQSTGKRRGFFAKLFGKR